MDRFSKIFSLIFIFNLLITDVYAAPSSSLLVIRKEDEFLLPPYLQECTGGILNVTSDHITDRKNKRSSKPGEWLDYGDSLATPVGMAVYVQMNEGLQWVGGGVLQAKLVSIGSWVCPPGPWWW